MVLSGNNCSSDWDCNIFAPCSWQEKNNIFHCFFTELKIYHLSYSIINTILKHWIKYVVLWQCTENLSNKFNHHLLSIYKSTHIGNSLDHVFHMSTYGFDTSQLFAFCKPNINTQLLLTQQSKLQVKMSETSYQATTWSFNCYFTTSQLDRDCTQKKKKLKILGYPKSLNCHSNTYFKFWIIWDVYLRWYLIKGGYFSHFLFLSFPNLFLCLVFSKKWFAWLFFRYRICT